MPRLELGYRIKFDVEDRQYTQTISRPAGHVRAGLGMFVSHRVSLAPRFDIVLPWEGERCTTSTGEFVSQDNPDGCRSVTSLIRENSENRADRRAGRRGWPRPWSVALDIRIVL